MKAWSSVCGIESGNYSDDEEEDFIHDDVYDEPLEEEDGYELEGFNDDRDSARIGGVALEKEPLK